MTNLTLREINEQLDWYLGLTDIWEKEVDKIKKDFNEVDIVEQIIRTKRLREICTEIEEAKVCVRYLFMLRKEKLNQLGKIIADGLQELLDEEA